MTATTIEKHETDNDPTRHEAAAHVSLAAGVRHGLTLTWRSLVKIKHSPEQLLDLTLQPIIFILLFVFVLGGGLFGSWQNALQYMLPGVLVQTVLFASLGTGVALNTDLTKGVFDRFRSLPIARSGPLLGAVLGDIVRYLVSGTIVICFGLALGYRAHGGVLGTIGGLGLVMLFSFALCWVAALLGIMVKTPQSVQGYGFIVMFPLTFGSNIFASPDTMPGWLQAWVKINPVTHVVNAARALMSGEGALAWPVAQVLLWAAGIVAVFFPLAIRGYRRKSS